MEELKIFCGEKEDVNSTTWQQRQRTFQGRKSKDIEERKKKPNERSIGEMVARTREFHDKPDMRSRIPEWVSRQSFNDLTMKNKPDNGQAILYFKSLTELNPANVSSIATKQFSYQGRFEYLKNSNASWTGKPTQRKASSTGKEPISSRRFSAESLSSKRPSNSNIPVIIRNNHVTLRKYSCPDIYPSQYASTYTSYNLEKEKELEELNAIGFGQKMAKSESSNMTDLSAKMFEKQNCSSLTRKQPQLCAIPRQNDDRRVEAMPMNDFISRSTHNQDNSKAHLLDLNSNESFADKKEQSASLSSEDRDESFPLEFYEEESLQSYSLNIQSSKQITPSSMYNARSNILRWLSEVDP